MTTLHDLIAELADAPAPVRPARPAWQQLAVWVAVSAAYIALLVVLFGVRPDIAVKLQAPMFVAELAMLGLVIVSTGLCALLLGTPDMRQMPGLVCLPLLPLAAFMGVLGMGLEQVAAPLPQEGLECLVCITLFSTVPALGIFYYLRRQASTHPKLTGAVAVLNAFSIGCFALRLSEETDAMQHLVLWHYLPMAGAALIGLGLGRAILKW